MPRKNGNPKTIDTAYAAHCGRTYPFDTARNRMCLISEQQTEEGGNGEASW